MLVLRRLTLVSDRQVPALYGRIGALDGDMTIPFERETRGGVLPSCAIDVQVMFLTSSGRGKSRERFNIESHEILDLAKLASKVSQGFFD